MTLPCGTAHPGKSAFTRPTGCPEAFKKGFLPVGNIHEEGIGTGADQLVHQADRVYCMDGPYWSDLGGDTSPSA